MEWTGRAWCPACTDGWAPGPRDYFEVVYKTRPLRAPLRPAAFACLAGHDVTSIVRGLPLPERAPRTAVPVDVRSPAPDFTRK
jgi:hypothetical protein